MHMDDEIAHLRVVDRLLRCTLPGSMGFGVVRKDADDVEFIEIAEINAIQRRQLATEDEVEELFGFGFGLQLAHGSAHSEGVKEALGRVLAGIPVPLGPIRAPLEG